MKYYYLLSLLFCLELVSAQEISDTTFVNSKDYVSDLVFDMKYATTDNFLKTKVYECDECFLRLKTVKALADASKCFKRKGYRIKIFDCYRPLDVQKKMWSIVSDPDYVANPARGSIHNRGGAIDITLVDENGNELDMGAGFDHFGPESAHSYDQFEKVILKNRKLLKRIMLRNGFEALNSEWWHYNLKGSKKDKVSNFTWNCP
ncbi:D-alanyl-D-alanine dipeptidase [Flavobacterium amniphilum]|uniref:D-alanyl-D-alanine dipeptidase n=1 Tax=Flavobacterium amniphilum TaxID=1834035 RepID=UPI00202A5FA3|nr:D-alanyl-D-alanine dipeptidase [Flavobacterium amniphilum]MCL9804343.1 D-alanyl-D-alanine dipeptidase [Flavobacterium amniphilum]